MQCFIEIQMLHQSVTYYTAFFICIGLSDSGSKLSRLSESGTAEVDPVELHCRMYRLVYWQNPGEMPKNDYFKRRF